MEENKKTKSGLPPAWDIMKEAWEVYKEKFHLLIGISLVPAIVGFALSIGNLLSDWYEKGGAGLALRIIVMILSVAAFILSFWSQAAILQPLAFSAQAKTVKQAYLLGRARIFMLLLAGILTGIAVLGGMIFLLVPGIIFALWFSLVNYIVVIEGIGEFKALKASYRYVIGRSWPVLWRWFCLGLAFIAVMIVASPFALFTPGNADAVRSSYEALISIFFMPWTAVYGYVLYSHLKRLPRPAKPAVAAE